jgi:hypothetical protein
MAGSAVIELRLAIETVVIDSLVLILTEMPWW